MMNQKQIPAMQQSTVSSFETLWCPGLISLLASLDSILSRLLSPSFCSSHDDHQCSLPCTPVWSVLHPSVVISQHLTPRTIPSFSCPWLLGCWILLVFVCLCRRKKKNVPRQTEKCGSGSSPVISDSLPSHGL